MNKKMLSEEIEKLEITHKNFNFRIGLSVFYSLSFLFQAKVYDFDANDPTTILFWVMGIIGVYLVSIMMIINLAILVLITKTERKRKASLNKKRLS